MTLGYCFECTKEMPTSQLKRCARCRMTTYFSRECQKKSWSEFHKYSCKPHDALEEGFRDPAIGTEEWKRLSTDNLINKWIGSWREVFGTCAVTTLDLANHPPDRIATHCLKAVVYLNRDPNIRSGSRLFQVLDARVCLIKELGDEFPNLFENVDLPGDSDEGLRLFRVRYVVFFGLPLQTDSGPMVNTFSRTVHWFDLRVQKLRQRMIDSPPPDWPTPETWLKMITTAVKDGDTTAFSGWSSKLAEMSHIERDELSGLLTY